MMVLTAKIKLRPTLEQRKMLLDTLEVANAACNAISKRVWDTKIFHRFDLGKLLYYDIRERFNLSAQMTIQAINKVSYAYKLNRKLLHIFKQHGAFPYDKRILSFKITDQTINIWTIEGRQRIKYICGQCQHDLLEGDRGQADLCYIDGEFYLFVSCNIENPESLNVEKYLGIDTGVKNIAVDSDGNIYSSSHLNSLRSRYARLRTKLQRKGTKSAKRLLKRRRYKESYFAKDVNHCISKQIVECAKDTERGIAVEDLKGIHDRVTARKAYRRQLHSWAFYDLQQKIEYKAKLCGVPVITVDPRNTSQTCPSCGAIHKYNRRNQAEFKCIFCGFSGHADHIAAINIGRRAAINQPYAGGETKTNLRAL